MKIAAMLAVSLAQSTVVVDGFTSMIGNTRNRFKPSQPARMTSGGSEHEYALLFDCDGVILETEEFHRLAYNAAFDAADLTIGGKSVNWSVEYYDVLQNTVGTCLRWRLWCHRGF